MKLRSKIVMLIYLAPGDLLDLRRHDNWSHKDNLIKLISHLALLIYLERRSNIPKKSTRHVNLSHSKWLKKSTCSVYCKDDLLNLRCHIVTILYLIEGDLLNLRQLVVIISFAQDVPNTHHWLVVIINLAQNDLLNPRWSTYIAKNIYCNQKESSSSRFLERNTLSCLGLVDLVHEKLLKLLVIKCIWLG